MAITTGVVLKATFRGGRLIQWSAVPNGNQGNGISLTSFASLTAQVVGTFGAGGSINIEGSNDNTNWAILHGPSGAATLTAAGMVAILELPYYVRPNVTAGDGTTALTCTILAVGPFV